MLENLRIETNPTAHQKNMVCGGTYRISVLTEMLVRLEYNADGAFEDRPTQMAWNRDFAPVDFSVKHTENGIEIRTKRLLVEYDEKEFSHEGLSITLLDEPFKNTPWHYGDEIEDLKGTARTLDTIDGDQYTMTKGTLKLGPGLISRDGFAVLDDSISVEIGEDGWIAEKISDGKDLYFFGYGHDYKRAIKDFYYLCGNPPMLPRFAFGNWWSRYYQYTEKTYLELMDTFAAKKIPLSVAVIDMDWHLVKIDRKYGAGWTGFTWNRELFPNPKAFLKKLHKRGRRVTLNLHPADGIRAFEEVYPTIAAHMGVDQEKEEPVAFDITDRKFVKYYFEDVLHPMEKDGINFWWMDWQQGSKSKIKNLDPLWMLNHIDYLDNCRNGNRGITLSRYSGPGSHRYPVGFSGDTYITWDSLRYQPYFTANASNIGFGWWSHDIGGHMFGYKDRELMTRWVQLGVFSPIMRLHSSNNEFHGKEPWKYGPEAEIVMTRFMRLRHRMIPYLYTMCHRNYAEGEELVQPLYYDEPENELAYSHKTEYRYGSELLVLPITSKRLPGLLLAKENIWLPEGIWFDVFNKRVYRGERAFDVYRSIDTMPVFAKAGGIIPLTDEIDDTDLNKNPSKLHINVYLGADGHFELYEDDNNSDAYRKGKSVRTGMDLTGAEGKNTRFVIQPAKGELSLIPKKRDYVIEMTGAKDLRKKMKVYADGKEVAAEFVYDEETHVFTASVSGIPVKSQLTFESKGCGVCLENNVWADVFKLLYDAEMIYDVKNNLFNRISKLTDHKEIADALAEDENLDEDLRSAVMEIVTAWQ